MTQCSDAMTRVMEKGRPAMLLFRVLKMLFKRVDLPLPEFPSTTTWRYLGHTSGCDLVLQSKEAAGQQDLQR
jgi:hypothetical protein